MAEHHSRAEHLFRRFLERCPDDATALSTFALLLSSQGRYEEALQFSSKAVSLDPESEHVVRANADIMLDQQSHAMARRATQAVSPPRSVSRKQADQVPIEQSSPGQHHEDFLRTAPARWPQLDRYKRQLLGALTVISGFQNWAHLAKLTGIDEKYLKGHWRKLVDLGMIVEEPGGYAVNSSILHLARQEQSHAVVTRIIHASSAFAMKPIFNSQHEYKIYTILLELFPHHLSLIP
jgi:tetratricopeptide (TPR) repeat protein